MKKIALILFCLLYLTSYGQDKNNPHIYLNFEEIDLEHVFINPMNIDSMRVEKVTKVGEIYIKTKSNIDFIVLDDVLKKYTQLDKDENKILFIIQDKIVTSESKVRIDNSFFIQVNTKSLSEVDYLDEIYKQMFIVDIFLSKEKIDPKIYLRGDRKIIDNLIYK